MDTTKWGPPMWKALHTMAHNFDPMKHDRKSYKQFFELLADTLPCIHCRNSYQEFIKELPIDPYIYSNKPGALHYWLYQIHNKVNNKLRNQGFLNKPDPSFVSVCAKYDKFRANCGKKKGKGANTCRIPDIKNRCQAKTDKGRQCTRTKCDKSKRCAQHKKTKSRKYSRSQTSS